jgi:hypothetical protein
MEKDLDRVKEHYNENYFNDEIANRINYKVHQRINNDKRGSIGKRIAYVSCAALAAFSLFVGSAFVSPTMQNVAAKIPYLNVIFESKPINDEIWDTLNDKGYKIDGFGMSYTPKKIATVSLVGSETDVNEAKPEVIEIVRDILNSRNYDAYKIEVQPARKVVEPTPEERKAMEEQDKASSVVVEVLKNHGYQNFSFGSDVVKKTVNLDLPNTETKVAEIKQQIQNGLDVKKLGTFSIEVKRYDAKKKEREGRWMPIIDTIAEGIFGNNEYQVDGVGYTNRYSHMTITIRTSVKSTDGEADKVVKNIEMTIQDFLMSEKTKKAIKDDPYKVIILTKDKKKHEIIHD